MAPILSKPDHALTLDGAHGEGGGQILRTALAASAITGRPVDIVNVRAGRPKPGLAAQHLTAIRALAAICEARLDGDELGSTSLRFAPGRPVASGDYCFDVAAARQGGSAGAACLVMQSVLVPLALAPGSSSVSVRGGTHVPWSPAFDYLSDVWLAAVKRLGMAIELSLARTGWYPAGEGEVRAEVMGRDKAALRAVDIVERGTLTRISGRALTANLVSHIARRMADRVRDELAYLDVPIEIVADRVEATSPGAGIFLTARYDNIACGFGAIGRRGKLAEAVAQEAIDQLVQHHRSEAALDRHLADQILLPLALADSSSVFSCAEATRHLETNAWVIEQFELAKIDVERSVDATALVTVTPLPG